MFYEYANESAVAQGADLCQKCYIVLLPLLRAYPNFLSLLGFKLTTNMMKNKMGRM